MQAEISVKFNVNGHIWPIFTLREDMRGTSKAHSANTHTLSLSMIST